MIYLIISILLDGIISRIVPMNSTLLPMFTLITLLLIYPKYKNKYHMFIIVAGILYDFLYSDIPFLNLTIFSMLSFVILYLYNDIPNNYISLAYKIIYIIIVYRLISYIISIILGNNFNIEVLYNTIINSIILNILYGYLLNDLLNRNYRKV